MVREVGDNPVVIRGINPCKADSLELHDLAALLDDAPLADCEVPSQSARGR